jgi:hypothetical protein
MRRRGSRIVGKKLPLRNFGISIVRSPALIDNVRVTVPVALVAALITTFVAAGADRSRGFGLDQRLQRPLGNLSDQIDAVTDCSPTRNASSSSDRADFGRPSRTPKPHHSAGLILA